MRPPFKFAGTFRTAAAALAMASVSPAGELPLELPLELPASWTLSAGDLTKNLRAGHPRVILTNERLAVVREQARTEPGSLFARAVVARADALVKEPALQRIREGRRLLGVSREFLSRATHLAMAFHLTGKREYVERLDQEARAVAAFRDWNPSHFLDVAEMTAGMAVAYDWLYHELSPESRDIMAKAIVEKGIEPGFPRGRRAPGWSRGDNNWNQVCNGGLALGALAIAERDPELAARVVTRSRAGMPNSIKVYAPEGAYPEGPGYWEYGTSYNVLFIEALRTALGTDLGLAAFEPFRQSARFRVILYGPTGRFYSYADNGDGRSLVTPTMTWFAHSYGLGGLIDMAPLLSAARGTRPGRLFPLHLLWLKDLPVDRPKPKEWLAVNSGGELPVGAFRTAWDDPDALYLACVGGRAASNHAHADNGSFIFELDNVRWAIDPGPESYHKIESRGIGLWDRSQHGGRWKVHKYTNFAHNTLTANGQLHDVNGRAEFVGFKARPGVVGSFGILDMAPTFGGLLERGRRGFKVLDKRTVLIQDEWKASPGLKTLTWRMLTPAKVSVEGAEVALRKDDRCVALRFHGVEALLKSGEMRIAAQPYAPPADYDQPHPDLTVVEATLKGKALGRGTLAVTLGAGVNAGTVFEGLEKW